MEQYNRDLNDMAVFAEIAAAGGFSAAAKKMRLPKSNISRRLARLEARLGVQLIERSTRSNRLTSIGECYVDYCRRMLEEAIAADETVLRNLQAPSGVLRISASVLVGQQVMAPVIAGFSQRFPAVNVTLKLSNTRVNLIEEGFDLAFRIGEQGDSATISQSLGRFPMHLFATRDYLAQAPEISDPADLDNHRCLSMSNNERRTRWLLEDGDNTQVKGPIPTTVANDFVTLKHLALENAGITMLPTYAIHQDLQDSRLVRVLPEWQGKGAELSAIYPSRRGATAKVREFIKCARLHLRECAEPKNPPL